MLVEGGKNDISRSVVVVVGGGVGGAHKSGCCIPINDATQEVNYMGNQPRPNFNAGGYSGFQHGQNYNSSKNNGGLT